MNDAGWVTIKVAIPSLGQASVYSSNITVRDSVGTVTRSMKRGERLLVARALVSFLGTLIA